MAHIYARNEHAVGCGSLGKLRVNLKSEPFCEQVSYIAFQPLAKGVKSAQRDVLLAQLYPIE